MYDDQGQHGSLSVVLNFDYPRTWIVSPVYMHMDNIASECHKVALLSCSGLKCASLISDTEALVSTFIFVARLFSVTSTNSDLFDFVAIHMVHCVFLLLLSRGDYLHTVCFLCAQSIVSLLPSTDSSQMSSLLTVMTLIQSLKWHLVGRVYHYTCDSSWPVGFPFFILASLIPARLVPRPLTIFNV